MVTIAGLDSQLNQHCVYVCADAFYDTNVLLYLSLIV